MYSRKIFNEDLIFYDTKLDKNSNNNKMGMVKNLLLLVLLVMELPFFPFF